MYISEIVEVVSVTDANNGGSCAWVGQGVCGTSLCLPLNFPVNLQLVKMNNIFLKDLEKI